MKNLLVVFFALTFLYPSNVHAWGWVAHQAMFEETLRLVSDGTRAEIHRILGQDSLADAAIWADKIKKSRPNTRKLHYVNVADGSDFYDMDRDCHDGQCVVEATKQNIRLLRTSRSEFTRHEALLFLIHFVGDLHQPFHVYHPDGKGGNKTLTRFEGKNSNVHAVLDTEVFRKCDIDIYEASLRMGDIQSIDVDGWANESIAIAKQISFPATCEDLGWLAEYQLALAANRLAYVLDEVLGESCCSVCVAGVPCGDSRISKHLTCSKPRGCACSGV